MVMPSEKSWLLFWTCLNRSFFFLFAWKPRPNEVCFNVGSGFWTFLSILQLPVMYWPSCKRSRCKRYWCQLVQNESLRQPSCLCPSYLHQPLRCPSLSFCWIFPFWGVGEPKMGSFSKPLHWCGVICPCHPIRTPETLCSSWENRLKFKCMFSAVN